MNGLKDYHGLCFIHFTILYISGHKWKEEIRLVQIEQSLISHSNKAYWLFEFFGLKSARHGKIEESVYIMK